MNKTFDFLSYAFSVLGTVVMFLLLILCVTGFLYIAGKGVANYWGEVFSSEFNLFLVKLMAISGGLYFASMISKFIKEATE